LLYIEILTVQETAHKMLLQFISIDS